MILAAISNIMIIVAFMSIASMLTFFILLNGSTGNDRKKYFVRGWSSFAALLLSIFITTLIDNDKARNEQLYKQHCYVNNMFYVNSNNRGFVTCRTTHDMYYTFKHNEVIENLE